METKNVYQMVTDRITEQLAAGIVPWQKPWSFSGEGTCINYVSRKPYSFLNTLLLQRQGEWLTFKQVQQLKGRIKKGAKAGMVVFYSTMAKSRTEHITHEDGTTEDREHVKMIPVLKYYHVFHLEDVEGIDSKLVHEAQENEGLEPDEVAEDIITAYIKSDGKLKFHNTQPSAEAFYSPVFDSVTVPMLSQYKEREEYYSTCFHELVHSTGAKHRLNREDGMKAHRFGSKDYSREELVAEMGSAMLCRQAKLDSDKAFNNSVAYINGWMKKLTDDPKVIVWAASRAEKAARYILGEKDKY